MAHASFGSLTFGGGFRGGNGGVRLFCSVSGARYSHFLADSFCYERRSEFRRSDFNGREFSGGEDDCAGGGAIVGWRASFACRGPLTPTLSHKGRGRKCNGRWRGGTPAFSHEGRGRRPGAEGRGLRLGRSGLARRCRGLSRGRRWRFGRRRGKRPRQHPAGSKIGPLSLCQRVLAGRALCLEQKPPHPSPLPPGEREKKVQRALVRHWNQNRRHPLSSGRWWRSRLSVSR